jgi:two-component system OmpR family sensor kinase
LGIDLLSSEKRSLLRFLIIYLTSTFLLFSLASWIFYTSTKHSILDKQKEILKYESQHIKSKLRSLHRSDKKRLLYPKNSDIKSAIYDLDKNYIFGTFNAPLDEPMSQDKIYLISQLEPYYLGAAYLKVYKKIDSLERSKIKAGRYLRQQYHFIAVLVPALLLLLLLWRKEAFS